MEQNTDRMYWTVGIIVIGALIIAGAAYLFPDLLGQIGTKITTALNGKVEPVNPIKVIPPIGG